MLKRIRTILLLALLALSLQGCTSGPAITGDLGFSGGVPITGRALASTGPGTTMEIKVEWPVSVSGTATFRYYVLDYTSAASPQWTPQSNALNAISGDADGDWDVDVPASGTLTTHSVVMKPALAKTYRVVVLVTVTNAGTEYVAACWFEAKP